MNHNYQSSSDSISNIKNKEEEKAFSNLFENEKFQIYELPYHPTRNTKPGEYVVYDRTKVRQGIIPPHPLVLVFEGDYDQLIEELKQINGIAVDGILSEPIENGSEQESEQTIETEEDSNPTNENIKYNELQSKKDEEELSETTTTTTGSNTPSTTTNNTTHSSNVLSRFYVLIQICGYIAIPRHNLVSAFDNPISQFNREHSPKIEHSNSSQHKVGKNTDRNSSLEYSRSQVNGGYFHERNVNELNHDRCWNSENGEDADHHSSFNLKKKIKNRIPYVYRIFSRL